jgi:16S rRNA (guanine527-N7)-methyltransferase
MVGVSRETSGSAQGETLISDASVKTISICRRNGVLLTDAQQELLRDFVGKVIDWNKEINLISRRDVNDIWYAHVLHCISPLFLLDVPPGFRLLDLGSGGGFPGIPWAIARADLNIILLDSVRKKTVVLNDIVTRLALKNVSVVTGRAEQVATNPMHAHRYDAVIARAVAPLVDLIRWSRPFVRRESGVPEHSAAQRFQLRAGDLVALKGGDVEREILRSRAVFPSCAITVLPIDFSGSLEIGLEGKKILVARG